MARNCIPISTANIGSMIKNKTIRKPKNSSLPVPVYSSGCPSICTPDQIRRPRLGLAPEIIDPHRYDPQKKDFETKPDHARNFFATRSQYQADQPVRPPEFAHHEDLSCSVPPKIVQFNKSKDPVRINCVVTQAVKTICIRIQPAHPNQ